MVGVERKPFAWHIHPTTMAVPLELHHRQQTYIHFLKLKQNKCPTLMQ